ncbi:MAG: pyridoxamine 5'-phosphate oxidase family protein [Betaproteobacteria bacterium]|nr:MAG: pyridoxamine 5'-phosphate oxidase family protein [Betaproteobacteria bacterium]
MPTNFPRIAFTASVKAQQEKHGSRRQYERMEAMRAEDTLTEREAEFISERDSFYMATVGENGYPYVQFRGGPRGFLKVLDAHTLAYADFRGNRQYVSVGNLEKNNRAALILMDYPNRRRLKIYATIEARNAAETPELIATLADPGYPAVVERAMVLHVGAFDWNCPQHIIPRYTLEEMRTAAKDA